MIALTIISLVVASLFFVVLMAIRSRMTGLPTTYLSGTEHPGPDNSRGSFVRSIIAGYFMAMAATTAGFVVLEGSEALSMGAFFLIASPMYALPVLLVAATLGYPVYRTIKKDSIRFPVIWLAYSAAALTSALCTALLASLAIFRSLDTFYGIAAFMSSISLLVALTSALFSWARQRKALTR